MLAEVVEILSILTRRVFMNKFVQAPQRRTKELIVQADDLGIDPPVNFAIESALNKGRLTSTSSIVVSPYFPDACRIIRKTQNVSNGLHLTFNCENPEYGWRPASDLSKVPSLTTPDGLLYQCPKQSEGDSGALHTLPSELSSELSRFVYTRAQYKERMGTEFSGATKKNGILYGKAEILRVAHYPVLYCREVNVHARGEVYWFLRQLEAHGGALIYAPTLNLKHSPLSQRPLEAWLRATVLGTVLWWTFRSDEILQREELYRRFEELKTWLLGNNTASRSFLDCNDPILDFELVKTFSDHVVGASFQRALMWDEIVSNDLARVMEAELPFFQAIRTLIGSR
jgi:hypothetical protein